MADALGVESIFISDGTTPSRRAGVDVSGNQKVILASNSGVDIGDVDILSLPAGNLGQQLMAASLSMVPASNITDATYIGDIKFGESLPAGANTIGIVDLGATDYAVLDSIFTNTADLPNVIGTDGAAGPTKAVSVAGTDGSGNLQEIATDTDGHIQVDILSGGGSTAPTNPAVDVTNITTPVSIAGNLGTGNLDSADLATKKLRQVCVYGARAFRVIVSTLSNGTATPVAIGGGGIDSPFVWEPPHEDFAVSGSSAGADGFRAAVVNLDPVDTTDFYASFAYND